jgi:folate-binding protein YgfZ
MDAAATCWAWHPEGPCRLEQPVWLLRLDGADALRFLHGQSSQAIALAPAGSALATCLISPTARMRALARVLVDDQGAWLLIETGDPEAVRAALDRVLFPADQVQLGPLQQALLFTLLGDDNLLSKTSLLGDQPQGEPGRWQPLSATNWLVEHQVLLQGAASADPAGHTGAHPLLSNSRPLSALEQERWRIQQGWPAAPGELNDGTNPFELGLAARVSLSKGCYVGQETLAKLATYDGVKQQLRRWCWQTKVVSTASADGESATAAALIAGQTLWSPSGDKAGTITSVLQVPQSDGTLWIGLALVRRSALEHEQLRAGEAGAGGEAGTAGEAGAAGEGPWLTVSVPQGFVPPPAAQKPASA